MRRINKEINIIPRSLSIPGTIPGDPRPPRTTQEKRLALINGARYIYDHEYDERYKQEDTIIALKELYNNKCAYCEQFVEQTHVEHYRPKAIYYWLAYSWDNLILCCPKCNEFKSNNFRIRQTRVSYSNPVIDLVNIHELTSYYNQLEEPYLVNPEYNFDNTALAFNEFGVPSSIDPNLRYTIEVCRLDRSYLNDKRKEILDAFKNDLRAELLLSSGDEQKNTIALLVRQFKRRAADLSESFNAFRQYCLENDLLKQAIRALYIELGLH